MPKQSNLPGLPKDIGLGTYVIDGKMFICEWSDIFKRVVIRGKKFNRYIVDILGNVYNEKINNRLCPVKHKNKENDYYRVMLTRKKYQAKTYAVHRIVAEAFIPNPNKLPQVNHKDGNKENNTVYNLEWVTAKENMKHAYANNLNSNKGEKNPKAKLTNSDVENIWKNFIDSKNLRDSDIAAHFGVSDTTINNIRIGRTWSDFYEKYSKFLER